MRFSTRITQKFRIVKFMDVWAICRFVVLPIKREQFSRITSARTLKRGSAYCSVADKQVFAELNATHFYCYYIAISQISSYEH